MSPGGLWLDLDGLVGPTHNYAGLARDNVASRASVGSRSSPRRAALQGIAKMRALHRIGVPQAVLPPHERPHVPTLRRLGFSGDDAAVLAAAGRRAPELLAACSSASAMWAANAATASPSADTRDGRVHLTPANLVAHAHRAIEPPTTTRVLRRVFADRERFVVHDALPATPTLADEGAANQMRLGAADAAGVEAFVAGAGTRQAHAASRAVARLHGLGPATLHLDQAAAAVAAGAFHNDVVAVAHADVLLCHERAFADAPAALAALEGAARGAGVALRTLVVPDREVDLADAVASYLLNSQIVTGADGVRRLVAPAETREVASVARWLDRLEADPESPIGEVLVVDVRESMRNGGGPACLRLCVPLRPDELAAVHAGVVVDDALLDQLERWVLDHHRDRLDPADLSDPALLREGLAALDELSAILGIGSVHDFQAPLGSAR